VTRLLFALLFTASAAHAEDWLRVTNLDARGGVLYIDAASIDRSTELRKAWFKSVYPDDRPIGDGYRDLPPEARTYRWESSLGWFNCTEKTIAVSQSILHGADDQVVGTLDVDPAALKYRAVEPRSIGGLMLEAVCATSASGGQSTPASARVTYAVNPDDYFPKGAAQRGENGAPIVKICVGPSGALLREPEITEKSPFPDLDAAAVKVAKAMRYAAAVVDGVAQAESCMKFKVKFATKNY